MSSGNQDISSPFGDPFADPSITQAASTTTSSNLDDYNPFNNPNVNPPLSARSSAGPAVLETASANGPRVGSAPSGPSIPSSSSQPPAYTPTSAQTLTHDDLLRKQQELERKAAELAAREEAIRNGTFNVRQPNWPPVPSFCPFGPFLYQDINVEIPVEFQRIVRHAYYLWMYFIAVLLANLIGGIAKWTVEDNAGYFTFSLMSLLILTPGSFLCWFRPLYKAFRSDSSFNFMVFFFVFFIQLVMSVIWAIGIPGSGACGLIVAITSLTGHGVFYGFLMFSICIVLISYAVGSLLMLLKVHSIYRSTGASFDKAKAEFASGVMSNAHVQQAAAGAARQAMSSAFTSATSGGATPTNGRPNTSGIRF